MDTADLPPSRNLAGDSVVEILLAWAERKFVQVADDERVRDVLIAHGLLSAQVVGVLRAKDV